MTFTTTGDVAELRRRIARMAEMHNQHHGREGHGMGMHAGDGDAKDMHGGEGHGMGMQGGGMMMPPSTARSEEIESGARLVLMPTDPADLPKLREHARQHAERMATGQCPMMAMHSQPGEAADHEAHHPPGAK